MGSYTETALIDAPIQEVYDFRLDFSNLPRYNADVLDLTVRGGADPAPGTVYDFKLRLLLGIVRPATLEIVAAQRPDRIEITIDAFIAARETCHFESRDAKTFVEFTTEIATPGGPLAPVLDRLFILPTGRRQVRGELELIDELLRAAV